MYQSPQTNVKYYLKDRLNIELFKLLNTDPDWKCLFEPLDFFNELYKEFEFFNRNQSDYAEICTHFGKLELAGKKRLFFLNALRLVIQRAYFEINNLNSKDEPVIASSIEFINELYQAIALEFFPPFESSELKSGTQDEEVNFDLKKASIEIDKTEKFNNEKVIVKDVLSPLI